MDTNTDDNKPVVDGAADAGVGGDAPATDAPAAAPEGEVAATDAPEGEVAATDAPAAE